ncbi:MAG: nitroreductase family deazaflavin-dependent oxidoreductase, partial [Chloroflexi bacterium]|nr:nitroreductase family deazaflavin-dependent oxidoreductase [Chloroflexota bacterium]
PVVYFRQGEDLVVVASNRGVGLYPAWYWNLQFNSQAWVQIGRIKQAVSAKEARPEERRFLWPVLVEKLPLLTLYQTRTKRELPVVILRPVWKP